MHALTPDLPPDLLMAQAAALIDSGQAQEIELEWWADPEDGDGPQRRLTVTVRATDRNTALATASSPLLPLNQLVIPDSTAFLDGTL